ncbi:MAG: Aldehyde dehydrogenase, partial [uncultured Gemmatimonadetes bacterium]
VRHQYPGGAAPHRRRVAGGGFRRDVRDAEPVHGRGAHAGRVRGRGGRGPRRARRPRGVRKRRLARDGRPRPRPPPVQDRGRAGGARRRARPHGGDGQRQARARGADDRHQGVDRLLPLLRGVGGQDRRRRDPRPRPLPQLHAPRADGRVRGHHPLELPAADGGVEGGPGHRLRQHHGAEAGRADPAHRPGAGPRGRRGGAPGRGAERGDGLRRVRGGRAGQTPGRGQDRLHRLHRGRQDHPARGRRLAQARVAGAGRQEPQHRPGRRGPGRGGQGRGHGHLLQRRPGLHRRLAPAGGGVHPRRVRGQAGEARGRDEGRRPARPQDAPGPAGLAGADGPRAELRGKGQGGGRRAPDGRRAGGGQRDARLLPEPHHLRPRDAGDDHRAGGDLRPGAGDHDLQGHGRGDPHRQLQHLRPGRRRVDARHRQGPPCRAPAARRHGVDQHLPQPGHRFPLWRLQAERLRPRAGEVRARPVYAGEERVGEPGI